MRTIHNRVVSEPFTSANFSPHPTDPLTPETFIAIDGLAVSVFGELGIGNLGDAHAISLGEGRVKTIELYRELAGRSRPELTVRSYTEGDEDYMVVRLKKQLSPFLRIPGLGASRAYFTRGYLSTTEQLTNLQVESFIPVIQRRVEDGTFVRGDVVDH
jgi:hypothetical protein